MQRLSTKEMQGVRGGADPFCFNTPWGEICCYQTSNDTWTCGLPF